MFSLAFAFAFPSPFPFGLAVTLPFLRRICPVHECLFATCPIVDCSSSVLVYTNTALLLWPNRQHQLQYPPKRLSSPPSGWNPSPLCMFPLPIVSFLVFLVLRRPCGAVECVEWSIFSFCRTQLAHLSLARLLARLETSQESLVRETR